MKVRQQLTAPHLGVLFAGSGVCMGGWRSGGECMGEMRSGWMGGGVCMGEMRSGWVGGGVCMGGWKNEKSASNMKNNKNLKALGKCL